MSSESHNIEIIGQEEKMCLSNGRKTEHLPEDILPSQAN